MRKRINVGISGLGRLGKKYATILHHHCPYVNLVSTCSLDLEELKWAKFELGVSSGHESFTDMIENNNLDAVFIISSTNAHASQIKIALENDLHVFCEKPLSIDLNICQDILNLSKKLSHLKSTIGFVRRFDESYMFAKEQIKSGKIGLPFKVYSQTVDKDAVTDFQIQYAKSSGGIFHDYNIHDIDLTRWLLEDEFKTVHAIGGAYKYPAYTKYGDADNVTTTCQMSKGGIAVINASRTAAHGHDTFTEITGTKGTLRIGRPNNKNIVEICDESGVRYTCLSTFWDRFEMAFHRMINDFIEAIHFDHAPKCTIEDAVKATIVASAFTNSFEAQEVIKL